MEREVYLQSLKALKDEIKEKSDVSRKLKELMRTPAQPNIGTAQAELATVRVRLTLLHMLRCQLRVESNEQQGRETSRGVQHLLKSRYRFIKASRYRGASIVLSGNPRDERGIWAWTRTDEIALCEQQRLEFGCQPYKVPYVPPQSQSAAEVVELQRK